MTTAKLRKVGGSTMLAIPPGILDAMNLSAAEAVDLSVEDGALVVKRVRPHYTLDQLLAECGRRGRASKEDRAWLNALPVGREL